MTVVDLMDSYYFINSRLHSFGHQILPLDHIESIVKVAITKLITNYDSRQLVSPHGQVGDIEEAYMVIQNNYRPLVHTVSDNKICSHHCTDEDSIQDSKKGLL